MFRDKAGGIYSYHPILDSHIQYTITELSSDKFVCLKNNFYMYLCKILPIFASVFDSPCRMGQRIYQPTSF